MNNYRKICAALLLACALSAPALAGEMHTDRTQPPPPPEQRAGEMHTGKDASMPVSDTLTGIALNLLQTLLPLF